MKKQLIILGSTSAGKTDLALFFARKLNGEIIACDSRQVYKGLDIGTGKLSTKVSKVKKKKYYWEINGIKIWMYDVVSPKKQYSVADYVKDATKILEEIAGRGKLPIIVGGTGLYLKALLQGFPNLEIPINQELRRKLEELPLEGLQKKLQKLSPIKWKKMNNSDRNNRRRLLRLIEIVYMYPYMDKNRKLKIKNKKNNCLKIGLTAPRQILYKKIDARVFSRIKAGMIDEALNLHQQRLSFKRMRQLGLEYGQLVEYLTGRLNKTELISQLQVKIHQYSKRQMTWFKNQEKGTYWFDITKKNWIKKVEKQVLNWYNT